MRKINIIYFPANKNYNSYNTRMQEILSVSGTRPIGINSILTPKKIFKTLTGTKNVFIFNWFEDYPFNSKGQVSPKKFIAYLGILAYAKAFGKIIYIKHNFTKHNLDARYRKAYSITQYLIEKIATKTYVHSKTISHTKKYNYLPHPLYETYNIKPDRPNSHFLCFGMISRYKGYTELLKIWPRDYPLLIAGACNDTKLIEEINKIILAREINVTIDQRVLTDTELELAIRNSIAILLPHTGDSCIVSGAAYLAFSLGSLVLIKDIDLYNNISEPALTHLLDLESIKNLYENSDENNSPANREQRLKYAQSKYSDPLIYENIKETLTY